MKILPLGPYEAAGADILPAEREGSRRFAKKVMYLAVIACPEDDHNFDGKIYFTRVARTRKLGRDQHSNKLIDELSANEAIHQQWHEFVDLTMSPSDMKNVLREAYHLTDLTFNRLVIRFKDHRGGRGIPKWTEFEGFQGATISPDPQAARRPLQIKDLELRVVHKNGEEVPVDVSCDSQFMMEHMNPIGEAIRAKYDFLPHSQEIYLVMDNAGGHGTRDTIDHYVADLLETHNVRTIWQEPRGPELNLLDLGAWMSLQSAVEKHFRGTQNDQEALARKIEETWNVYDSTVFRRIYDRWVLALDLIIADGGDNRLVNEHRGLFMAVVDTPEAPSEDDDDDDDDDTEEY
jgi:hypothetical protein